MLNLKKFILIATPVLIILAPMGIFGALLSDKLLFTIPIQILLLGAGVGIYLGIKRPQDFNYTLRVLAFTLIYGIFISMLLGMILMRGAGWIFLILSPIQLIYSLIIVLPILAVVNRITALVVQKLFQRRENNTAPQSPQQSPEENKESAPEPRSARGGKGGNEFLSFKWIIIMVLIITFPLLHALTTIFMDKKVGISAPLIAPNALVNDFRSVYANQDAINFSDYYAQSRLASEPNKIHAVLVFETPGVDNVVYRTDVIPITLSSQFKQAQNNNSIQVVELVPLIQYIPERKFFDAQSIYKNFDEDTLSFTPVKFGLLQQLAVLLSSQKEYSYGGVDYYRLSYYLTDVFIKPNKSNATDAQNIYAYINLNTFNIEKKDGGVEVTYHIFVPTGYKDIELVQYDIVWKPFADAFSKIKPANATLEKKYSPKYGYDYYVINVKHNADFEEEPLQLKLVYDTNKTEIYSPQNKEGLTGTEIFNEDLEHDYLKASKFIPVLGIILTLVGAGVIYFVYRKVAKKYSK